MRLIDKLVAPMLSSLSATELPMRELKLIFNLPVQLKDKRYSPERSLRDLQSELRLYKDMPLNQIELAIDQLSKLVVYKCSVRKRFAMLEVVSRELSSLICEIYVQYRDEQKIPESESCKCNLDKLLELIRLLIVGYQQVFDVLYRLSDFRYRGQRKRIQLTGFRILELIYVEQRVCARRYQLFPAQHWKDINQVFFFLWHYEHVDQLQPLIIALPNHLRGNEYAEPKGQKTTPKQLYISMQVFGLVDCYTWPSEYTRVLDSYLKLFEPQLGIKHDGGAELERGHLLTFHNWERAPLYRRAGSTGLGSLIDITSLKRKINQDFSVLHSLNEAEALLQISPPLSVLEHNQRLLFIEVLKYKLQPKQRRDQREIIDAYRDFTITSGFMNCHQKLPKGVKKIPNDEGVLKLSLGEMLEGRSSILADDSRDVKHGEWFVVNDSKGGVLVRTKETRYLAEMEIGQLALFNSPNEPEGMLQLGYLSRLMRSGQGEINVTLQKIATKAESVAVQTVQMHKSGEAVPAFLIRTIQEASWQLLVPARYVDQLSNSGLFMRRGGRLMSMDVADVSQRHKEFSLLVICSTKST